MARQNAGIYRELLQTQSIPCEDTIARDINRTYPKHHLFTANNALGQSALANVLSAYSLHDPDVGYCQGMAFLSAMFLSYMPEEQSFWHIVACLNHKRYDLASIYRPGMPKVGEIVYVFEKLMMQHLPRVTLHLEKEGVHPTTYLSQVGDRILSSAASKSDFSGSSLYLRIVFPLTLSRAYGISFCMKDGRLFIAWH